MAMFVEGHTELLFVKSLIETVAARNSVGIRCCKLLGGSKSEEKILEVFAANSVGSESHYVLIYDCGGDNQVKTRARRHYQKLCDSGYREIVCLRDVYPAGPADVGAILRSMAYYMPTKPLKIEYVLAVMEVEAWILAETTHFQRVDSRLTLERILSEFGFHPKHDDMSARPWPFDDLRKCYQLVGNTYRKGDQVAISRLDFEAIYLQLSQCFPDLAKLCNVIDRFLGHVGETSAAPS